MAEGIIESRNPAHPDDVVGRFVRLGCLELEAVLLAAEGARTAWGRLAPIRAAALVAWASAIEHEADPLAHLLAREVGKPISEARGEVSRTIGIIHYYAQAAFDASGELYPSPDGHSTIAAERIPLGIVLAITPWNFPLAIPAWKIAPALAYGNVVLFKPSSAAIATAHRFVELSRPHVSSDVLQLLTASGEAVEKLLDEERVAGVSFTGSAEVGQGLVARVASRGAAVQAEMGGQNASIILDDADLDFAARTVATSAMAFAGQKCTATSRVIIHERVADAFLPRLVSAVGSLELGDPQQESTVVGPVISREAMDGVDAAVKAATAAGAEVLIGGRRVDREGWFYQPALLRVADSSDRFVQEETFGPAAAVQIVADDEEAIRIANGTRFGLVAAVFGSSSARTHHVSRHIDAGMVRINEPTTGVDYYAPFGGEKGSSYGPREQGRAAREFFTRSRTITSSPGPG